MLAGIKGNIIQLEPWQRAILNANGNSLRQGLWRDTAQHNTPFGINYLIHTLSHERSLSENLFSSSTFRQF